MEDIIGIGILDFLMKGMMIVEKIKKKKILDLQKI
jgi:hypothetical protein